jgi:2-haloalkanoic acid dehalogenase type II
VARFKAVAFDLLTALLDPRPLWRSVAGSAADGTRWRAANLACIRIAGDYQPYEPLLLATAREAGVSEDASERLIERWGELAPWPDVGPVLSVIALPLGVVTNCSEPLARVAVDRVDARFDVVVSAERAGAYKPDPRPYRLALRELGRAPDEVLFVAGSAHDVLGAAAVGMPVYWANRLGAARPEGSAPLAEFPDFRGLLALLDESGR